MTGKTIFTAAMALAMLTACSEPDIILPGDRFDIRPNTDGANEARPISLPAMRANANWTERSGNAQKPDRTSCTGYIAEPAICRQHRRR